MADTLLRMMILATVGLGVVLLLRRPARRAFGASPAFTLWLLPIVLAFAPLLPRGLAPAGLWSLPALVVTPGVSVASQALAFDWTRWLIVLWLLGVSIGLARLVFHYVRLLRGTLPAPVEWSRLRSEMHGFDPRRLRVHEAGPAVLWALPGSLVLLPADFAQRFDDASARELVLRHELTHARRGDAWWSLAMEIVSALLWFHPLVWFARSRFRLDQELACDAASLRALPQRNVNYARALLDSVATQPVPALIPWLSEPQLKERIAMITRIPPGALRRRAGFLAVAALLVSGLSIAGSRTPLQTSTETPALIRADHLNVVDKATAPPSVDITYKNQNPPRYPLDAIKKGRQGMVILDITVDAAGKVIGLAVDPKGTTGASELQTAAIQAAQNWKFSPGVSHGKPVGGTVRMPIRFSLHEVNPCQAGEAYASTLDKCVKLQPVDKSS